MMWTARRPMSALCCRCGAARVTRIAASSPRIVGEVLDQESYDLGVPRCLVRRFCRPCRRRTAHAFIRLNTGPHPDYLESVMQVHGGYLQAYRRARFDQVLGRRPTRRLR